ncbi:hypothetical protein jhhlp_004493 [Lomentospora prolificans]|uniref:non-specific serine/threonine protein kinase n=1 Tax=Lomentospora prolificans TaxID=41688 RepID=A0A2N3NBQ5_9PEZI|nr:hypothetical protein jhhlp_004493 [Lomentospora prolificans]
MNQSQLAPLPSDLPFRIVSKTIGRGAYASYVLTFRLPPPDVDLPHLTAHKLPMGQTLVEVLFHHAYTKDYRIKKAVPLDQPTPVFAVKLIHKEYAIKRGRISEKQLKMEISLHSYVGQHPNVIEWFASGDDPTWQWIAMEFAEGGDLFDKIEADVGVPQDIAQVYFLQLVSGVSFIHSKGVAHRDLKPENILMSEGGSLKIADFGLACMFAHKGQRKMSSTLCGSPPYIAPEILSCRRDDRRATSTPKYDPELADIWSCGVILFVLLVGNTPWDEPSANSWEFQEYKRTAGRSSDPLWERIPTDAMSLLRGMLNVDPRNRFSFQRIRQHPWYTHNPHLTSDGRVHDPLQLATQMLENLRIDFSQQPPSTPSRSQPHDGMDLDAPAQQMSSTQPEAPINDTAWDWERPTLRSMGAMALSSTQPVSRNDQGFQPTTAHSARAVFLDTLAMEPSMSQFSQQPGVSMTLTQQARRFRDIMLSDALHQLNVPLPPVRMNPEASSSSGADVNIATVRVKALDSRRQNLHGEIQVDRQRFSDDLELLDVRFIKVKGDPLEWRRFFKNVVLLCKDGVYVPEE